MSGPLGCDSSGRFTYCRPKSPAIPSRMVSEEIACPNCGDTQNRWWATENGFNAVRCEGCRLIYVNPRPRRDLIEIAVCTGQHTLETGGRYSAARRVPKAVAYYEQVIRRLFADIRSPVAWLDVGAGYGETVEAAIRVMPAGSIVRGVEPMRPKAQHARSRGLDVTNAYLSPVDHGPADIISSINVFSHVPDFNAMLEQFRETLRPGGSLLIETGNLADLERRGDFPDELDLPDHLVFAGASQIRQYLHRAGFDIVSQLDLRHDTLTHFVKTAAKRMLGRPVRVGFPYSSAYRTMIIRARLRA